jgi:hypothetical protein
MRMSKTVIAIACAVCILAFAALIGGSRPTMHPSAGFSVNGEYPSVNRSSVSLGYGSWSGSDARIGRLTSDPFRAGFGVSLAISGYPSHAGETILLERMDGRGTIPINVQDPGETWAHHTVALPFSWFGHEMRLVAVDSSTAFQGWIGVADLRRLSPLEAIVSDIRVQLALSTIAAAMTLLPFVAWAIRLRSLAGLPHVFLFPITVILAGIIAEVTFFLTQLNTVLGAVILVGITLLGGYATVRALKSALTREELREVDSWFPFAVTLFAALIYVAVVDLTTASTASAMDLLPLIHLASDNALPHFLAEHVLAHTSARPFVNDWLTSDRPPLQAGFDLASHVLTPYVFDDWIRYEGQGIDLQATIFGLIFTLCRLCKRSIAASLGVCAIALCSGFFFINTIYIWPKLLSATYLGIAMVIGMLPGPMPRARIACIGIATALAMLSHQGVAFTLPGLVVAFCVLHRNELLRALAGTAIIAAVFFAPWFCYQHFYDPPGDRLEKWHLAGQADPSDVPFQTLLVRAYTTVPLATIIDFKERNVRFLFGGPLHTQADRELYYVGPSMGVVALPFLAALVLVRTRRFRIAGVLAWISVAGLAFWCLAMYLPEQTVIHQGSYLTMTLMMTAGALVAVEWWPLFAAVLFFQLSDFLSTWLAPASPQTFFTIGGIATFCICVVVVVLLARSAILALRSNGNSNSSVRASQ